MKRGKKKVKETTLLLFIVHPIETVFSLRERLHARSRSFASPSFSTQELKLHLGNVDLAQRFMKKPHNINDPNRNHAFLIFRGQFESEDVSKRRIF